MKKVIIVLLVLAVCGLGYGTFHYYREYNTATSEKSQLAMQNGELQLAIDAIGPITEVWTVNTEVSAGSAVREEELVKQTIPVSSVTEEYVMEKENIIGRYYKVDIAPGVSITKSLLMEDKMENITYERDMTFAYLPLGLKVGDYVDVRIVFPYGEEFIVFKHERVRQINKENNTIKLVLDEAGLMLWTSVLKDMALYNSKGMGVYLTKYIEPGITEEATAYYPVRKEMEGVVNLSPNISDKTRCVNSVLRVQMERMLTAVDIQHAGNLASGVTTEASNINNSAAEYNEESPTTNQSGTTLEDQVMDSYDDIINLDVDDMIN